MNRSTTRFPRALLALWLSALLVGSASLAQEPYKVPSPELAQIVDAPNLPITQLSPDQKQLLLVTIPALPSIAELAEPELRLAGSRIRPRIFGPSRSRPASGLAVVDIASGRSRDVTGLPRDARLYSPSWSPDGKSLSVAVLEGDALRPWVVDLESATARRLAEVRLNLTAGTSPRWLPDSSGLLVTLVPRGAGAAPERSQVPIGPIIQESLGDAAPARTYQDLLEDAHDEALYEHYFTSQIATVDLAGKVTPLGDPQLVAYVDASPDGRYVLVESHHRPFSYRVPRFRFPLRSEVWTRDGTLVATVADVPLQEGVPMAFGSVATGPRQIQWRPDQSAALTWVEALDGGDAGKEAPERDRVVTLAAPFDGEPTELFRSKLRYAGTLWGEDGIALLQEQWWKTRQTRTWRLFTDPQSPGEPRLVFDRSTEDRYGDPGRPLMVSNEAGRRVLQQGVRPGTVLLSGSGASPEGDRPFLDELDLETLETTRLFRSRDPYFERPANVVATGSGTQLVFSKESPTDPPNYFIADMRDGKLEGERQVTRFADPTPAVRGYSKEIIRYDRADGVELTGTLYLPPGYDPAQGPLPMLMWAYPREFKSASAASQVRGSKFRFDRVNYWSTLVWLTRGYAVLDNPAMPIVGEGDAEPNDTYVEQLVASAKAAVDEVVRRGVTAPGRIAIGGHSYGAFMTANLLSHSDLFAAGIARSGAYNRTLTPFGFQAEERSYWEAPEIYFAMSPFMHAQKVNEPILLIHGAVDNNSGTFPIQSERYYAALKGHGATARLVMLPLESHGYRARESLLHMLWEQEQWLEQYVRPKGGGAEASSGDR